MELLYVLLGGIIAILASSIQTIHQNSLNKKNHRQQKQRQPRGGLLKTLFSNKS